jgi:hypothetical protein
VGLDHLAFSVDSRDELERAFRLFDERGVPHGEIEKSRISARSSGSSSMYCFSGTQTTSSSNYACPTDVKSSRSAIRPAARRPLSMYPPRGGRWGR